ncbi:hypothetical protein [Streptomyces spongiae]|uniref:Integral membrane protein n=1 Tax=Streptomyces spongiae TaxID=565072 RepID=A0A5N8XTE5_9ACTN|nr:hypothetical protein [Streptomyces spongiae]MPY62318.1 hypothetical protein [Streptomyces spongiae]
MTAPHERTARAGGDLRVLRAAVFAAVCVVLAAAGHALASCATVPLWTLGAGFAAVFAVAAPLAGRERSLPGIATVLALGQTVLHTLFGLGQHSTSVPAGTSDAMNASLVERAARLVCGATAAAISPAQAQRILTDAGLDAHATHGPADGMAMATDSSASVLPTLPMLLGHVLAAVAAGWVLRHGDLALLRIVRLSAGATLVRSLRAALALVRALRSGLPGAPEAAPRVPRSVHEAPPAPRTATLQHTVIRRGPPSRAAVLVLAA